MNAIKLPVRVEGKLGGSWFELVDSDGEYVFHTGTRRAKAEEICIALNCHDALVEALKFYAREVEECRNRIDPDLPGTMNDWHADIGQDIGNTARAALAKIEDLRKKV